MLPIQDAVIESPHDFSLKVLYLLSARISTAPKSRVDTIDDLPVDNALVDSFCASANTFNGMGGEFRRQSMPMPVSIDPSDPDFQLPYLATATMSDNRKPRPFSTTGCGWDVSSRKSSQWDTTRVLNESEVYDIIRRVSQELE